MKEEKIGEALLKVALGYQIAEVTEEYAEVDGALKLTKRKKTKKDIPPDLKAVQILLSSDDEEYGSWSDEDLEKERKRLLKTLKEAEESSGEKKVVKKPTKAKTEEKPKEKAETVEKVEKKVRPKPRKRVVRKSK